MVFTSTPQSNRKESGDKSAASKNRTTILHITGDLDLHAQAREVVDLAIQTHRAGLRPLIVSAGGSLVLEAERAAVRHTKLPMKTASVLRSWRNRQKIEDLINRERPVLIHVHGYEGIGVALRVATKKNLPLLIDLTEPTPITPARRKLLHLAAASGACFRVPSTFMAYHLRNDLKLETDQLYRVAPGVDLVWYEASRVTPERIHRLHQSWRLPEQATVLVMATPLATGYGHQALLDAMTALTATDVYAVLIGDDKASPGMRARIEKMVADKGLEGRVIMPENCTDWPAACWLASMMIAVNVVPRGQAPEVLAAQAVGRPAIVTDCGANAELVKKNETAWVIEPDNTAALVEAIKESLAMGPSRRIDIAMDTRDFVAENFPMETWRDSIFALYDKMLQPPSVSASAAA